MEQLEYAALNPMPTVMEQNDTFFEAWSLRLLLKVSQSIFHNLNPQNTKLIFQISL